MIRPVAIVAFLFGCSGCATIPDELGDSIFKGMLDLAFEIAFGESSETQEEGQSSEIRKESEVRRDTERWKMGEHLLRHRSVDDPKVHRQSLWVKQYLDQLDETPK